MVLQQQSCVQSTYMIQKRNTAQRNDLRATVCLRRQTGQQWAKAEAAEAAETCLAAGLQLARRMGGDLTGPALPAALRERNAQLLFDILVERAIIAWTLQQHVPHISENPSH